MLTSFESSKRWLPTLLVAGLLSAITGPVRGEDGFTDRLAAITAQIQASPANPDLWLQRADVHRQQKEYESALTDVDKAQQLKPNWSLVSLERAKIFFDSGKLSDAVREATDCLKLEPANTEALILRARSDVWLKDFEPAITDYNAVLNNGAFANPPLDLYLERARAQAAAKKMDDAIHGLDQGMKSLGDTAALALPAIEYERERGTFEAALGRLERAKNYFSPESYQATRGEVLLQANRPAEAVEAFQAGLTAMQNLSADQRALPLNSGLEDRLNAGLKQATSMSAH